MINLETKIIDKKILLKQLKNDLVSIKSLDELKNLKNQYFGKEGAIRILLKDIKLLPEKEKKEVALSIQQLQKIVIHLFDEKEAGFGELQSTKELLKQEGVAFQKIILFGSYANGNAHIDSDIDVAVVLPFNISGFALEKIKDIIWWAKQINVKLEPHILSSSDFENRFFSLSTEIKKSGVAF